MAPRKTDKSSKSVKKAGPPSTFGNVLARLLDQIFGPASVEAGAILANELKAYKAVRAAALSEKIEHCLKARNVTPSLARQIPFGIGSRILRGAVEEDDDEVLNYWASLIASTLDPAGGQFNKAFIAILKDISAIETHVLRYLWLNFDKYPVATTRDDHARKIDSAAVALHRFQARDRLAAIENLQRLGCVSVAIDWDALDPHIINSNVFEMGGTETGTIESVRRYLNELKLAVAEIGGRSQVKYLTLDGEPESHADQLVEVNFRLTNLGIQLMLRCEPPNS